MKKTNRTFLLILVIIIFLILSGCTSGSGGTGGSTGGEVNVENAAKETVRELMKAIETYNIAIIRDLLLDDVLLEINDEGMPIRTPKTKTQLESEINVMETEYNEMKMKYNYKMIIDLDALNEQKELNENPENLNKNISVVINNSGGFIKANCTFRVFESAQNANVNIPWLITDKGNIYFELVKTGNSYSIKTMKILFEKSNIELYSSKSILGTYSNRGFGFGEGRNLLNIR